MLLNEERFGNPGFISVTSEFGAASRHALPKSCRNQICPCRLNLCGVGAGENNTSMRLDRQLSTRFAACDTRSALPRRSLRSSVMSSMACKSALAIVEGCSLSSEVPRLSWRSTSLVDAVRPAGSMLIWQRSLRCKCCWNMSHVNTVIHSSTANSKNGAPDCLESPAKPSERNCNALEVQRISCCTLKRPNCFGSLSRGNDSDSAQMYCYWQRFPRLG